MTGRLLTLGRAQRLRRRQFLGLTVDMNDYAKDQGLIYAYLSWRISRVSSLETIISNKLLFLKRLADPCMTYPYSTAHITCK